MEMFSNYHHFCFYVVNDSHLHIVTICCFCLPPLHARIFVKYNNSHPGYFGKVGMRYFHKTQNKFHCPIVNLDQVWNLVGDEVREKYAKAGASDKVRATKIYLFGVFSYHYLGWLERTAAI